MAITIQQAAIAFNSGAKVYFAPDEYYEFLSWERSTIPGVPFGKDTPIPGGVIRQIDSKIKVNQDDSIEHVYKISVSGKTLPLSRLFPTEMALKNALIAALNNKASEAAALEDTILAISDGVLDIGDAALVVSESVLDFGTVETTLTFEITNGNPNTSRLNWSISTDNPKVTVDVESGKTTDGVEVITVSVDKTDVLAGDYTPTITIASDGGNATIGVLVTVEE